MSFFRLLQPLQPETMDTLLALGFYRMQQSLFTTHFTVMDDSNVIEVLWARVVLRDYEAGRRYKAIRKRCNRFDLSLQPAEITEETERLYSSYATMVDFNAPASVSGFLLGEGTEDYFPGMMWTVRDQGRLIAVGYFDQGRDSAAGILNFYDPEYRKFSLSKWLYLESIQYTADQGCSYFYPGYIALGYEKFDYKLEAGKERMEIWEEERSIWIPYKESAHARQSG